MAIPDGLLHSIDSLDPLPITAQKLIKALDDENQGPAQLAQVVEFDPAVTSSVLRIANSAAYGGWNKIDTVRDAVVRLGGAKLLDIVLGDYLKRMKVNAPMYDLAEDDLWLHSAAASLAVKALRQERPRAGIPEIANVAALVHDIGKLVMVRYLKADVKQVLRLPGVAQVKTHIALQKLKQSHVLPLEHLTLPARTRRQVRYAGSAT